MAKPELGTKRTCPSCSTKYYDLSRDPIVCPSCGTVFAVVASARPERAAPVAAAPVEEKETVEVKRDEGVISLEEAEADTEKNAGSDTDADADDDDEAASIPDVEDVEDDDSSDDDTFLEEEEEEGDDVSGLLDVDAADEEDR